MFQLLIFLIASLIMQALQRNTRKAEKEREVTRFHTYFNPDCHSCSRISSYMLAVGGGTVFLSAGLSNPCLSATDVGDAGAQFHCCSCSIKYPTTVRYWGCLKTQRDLLFCTRLWEPEPEPPYVTGQLHVFPRWGQRWPAASESCLGSHLRDETVFLSGIVKIMRGDWCLMA